MSTAELGFSRKCLPQDYEIPNKILVSNPQREIGRKWNEIANELETWMRNPSSLANEDAEFPNRKTILRALELADKMASAGDDAPIAVVTDGSTGISFEWQRGRLSRWIEISPQGFIEEIIIDNGHVRARKRL